MGKQMDNMGLTELIMGLFATLTVGAWARLQARINRHEEVMQTLAVSNATLVEKLDSLSDKLVTLMAHEEAEEKEVKTALKEMATHISDMRVDVAKLNRG